MTDIKKYQRGQRVYTHWPDKAKQVTVITKTEKEEQKGQVNVEATDAQLQGVYTNLAYIGHSETEFVLDFLQRQPQQPNNAKLITRFITSVKHAKLLFNALEDNIKKYEARFGKIVV